MFSLQNHKIILAWWMFNKMFAIYWMSLVSFKWHMCTTFSVDMQYTISVTYWPLGDFIQICKSNLQPNLLLDGWSNLQNCYQMNVTRNNCWYISIVSGNKPSSDVMLAQIYVPIWHHWATLSWCKNCVLCRHVFISKLHVGVAGVSYFISQASMHPHTNRTERLLMWSQTNKSVRGV